MTKGFTLIELLVVIAIIGVLSSIVFASLNSARNKGYDAAVKSGLANSRSQAELYYNNNLNYNTVCTAGTDNISAVLLGAVKNSGDTDQIVANDNISAAGFAVCNDSLNNWASEMPLKTTGYYCVDSAGKSQFNAGPGLLAGGDYGC